MRFPKLNPDSLSTKIIAWSFIPTIIILTAVAWYTFYAYQKVTSELVIRQDQEMVELKIRQITENIIQVFNPVLVPGTVRPILYGYEQHPPARCHPDIRCNGRHIRRWGNIFIDDSGAVPLCPSRAFRRGGL
jgi:hypothetical protein